MREDPGSPRIDEVRRIATISSLMLSCVVGLEEPDYAAETPLFRFGDHQPHRHALGNWV
ncbi:hypothetical protein DPMN_125280 [Dreissena polymorpha]|uniref:Uncharacterized protein n=1 Tax=Dreissena polymorpha TaxID=45954 RepID=A0A9D4JTD1_DREPO|nr:hypothetical protein DPMN_125280 [Dreissena polymorpha]